MAVPLFNFCDLQLLGCATSGIISGGPVIQLLRSSTSGISKLWDFQWTRVARCSTSGVFSGRSRGIQLLGYARLGYSVGGPAVQFLRSSTAGICLWGIQWVAPLINFCDLQFLGCATSWVFSGRSRDIQLLGFASGIFSGWSRSNQLLRSSTS